MNQLSMLEWVFVAYGVCTLLSLVPGVTGKIFGTIACDLKILLGSKDTKPRGVAFWEASMSAAIGGTGALVLVACASWIKPAPQQDCSTMICEALDFGNAVIVQVCLKPADMALLKHRLSTMKDGGP